MARAERTNTAAPHSLVRLYPQKNQAAPQVASPYLPDSTAATGPACDFCLTFKTLMPAPSTRPRRDGLTGSLPPGYLRPPPKLTDVPSLRCLGSTRISSNVFVNSYWMQHVHEGCLYRCLLSPSCEARPCILGRRVFPEEGSSGQF